jgi:2-octaprenyl-6-methoxyphenol hydroxylase
MAGATLALALDQAGLKVALVDPEPPESQLAQEFDGRASAIAYGAFRQWRKLGLADELEPVAQPIRHIVVTDGGPPGAAGSTLSPARLDVSADPDARDEPLGWMLENRHIRTALETGLSRSGVSLFRPAEAVSVTTAASSATLELSDGRKISGRLVVGAEGRRSAVRKAAGIGISGWSYGQTGVVATVALAQPHGDTAIQHFMPSGPLAILPLTGQRASLVWTERTERAKALVAMSDEAFEALLARRFGDQLGRPRLIGKRFSYPLSLQKADAWAAHRIVLVGDSAHGVHPIAGQGLNLGLKDVAALSEILSEAAALGEDIGSTLILDRYARWRRFDTLGSQGAADLIARGFSSNNPLLRLARDVALTAAGALRPVQALLAREAGADLGDIPSALS